MGREFIPVNFGKRTAMSIQRVTLRFTHQFKFEFRTFDLKLICIEVYLHVTGQLCQQLADFF